MSQDHEPESAAVADTKTRAEGLVFPEGPRWHDGRLYFSDMHGHQVMALRAEGPPELVAVVDKPSGLGFMPDGGLLVVAMRQRALLRIEADGHLVVHADLSDLGGEFLNDMVVDSEGLAYVGLRIHRRPGEPPSEEWLVLVRPDGSHEVVADRLLGPNGTVITPDGATLILAESQGRRITAFARQPDGRLGERRLFAALGRREYPDGICLDAEGALWVGTAIGGQYLRVLDGGEVTHRFAPPAGRWATACMLGGADRRTLFCVTASSSLEGLKAMNDADSTDQASYFSFARSQSQGVIESVQVEVAGAGLP